MRRIEKFNRLLESNAGLAALYQRVALAGYRLGGGDPVVGRAAQASASRMNPAQFLRTLEWGRALASTKPLRTNYRPDLLALDESERDHVVALLAKYSPDDPVANLHRLFFLSGDLDTAAAFAERSVRTALQHKVAGPAPGEHSVMAGAFDALCVVQEALERHGERPFLISGTLLGLVREGQLLEHDDDLDIGLGPATSLTATEVAQLLGGLDGFSASERDRCVTLHQIATGLTIDVFLHYERDGLVWHGTEAIEWWNTPFELTERTIADYTFLVPADTTLYLQENYGDWRNPKAFYSSTFDTPNRVFRRNPAAIRFLTNEALGGLADGDRFRTEAALLALQSDFGIDIGPQVDLSDSA